jgi:hypothetical protein
VCIVFTLFDRLGLYEDFDIFLSVLKLPKLVAGLETSLNEYFSENSNAAIATMK